MLLDEKQIQLSLTDILKTYDRDISQIPDFQSTCKEVIM